MSQPANYDRQQNAAVPFQITKKMLQSLAPLPATAVQLLAMLEDVEAPLRTIADVAARDVGIAAALLRMANSSVFGVRGRVGNIGDALRVIGTAQARLLVLTWGIAQAGQKELRLYGLDSGKFMHHSEIVGTLSMAIAREVHYADAAMAYSAGLLHDIGKVIINAAALQRAFDKPMLQSFSAASQQPGVGIIELERLTVATDHASVGRELASLWALPCDLAAAIALHHANQVSSPCGLPAIVALANAVAGDTDKTYPELQRAPHPDNPVLPVEQAAEIAKEALQ